MRLKDTRSCNQVPLGEKQIGAISGKKERLLCQISVICVSSCSAVWVT